MKEAVMDKSDKVKNEVKYTYVPVNFEGIEVLDKPPVVLYTDRRAPMDAGLRADDLGAAGGLKELKDR